MPCSPLHLVPGNTPTPSRDAPCPCGSGRKYKHCHGRDGGLLPRNHDAVHDRDNQLTARLIAFTQSEIGDRWIEAIDIFDEPAVEVPFALSWGFYQARRA